jgi:hypothetical protein
MDFHGAFGNKAEAKRKEKQVHGFIREAKIRGEKRFVVMSPRKNPRPRRNAGRIAVKKFQAAVEGDSPQYQAHKYIDGELVKSGYANTRAEARQDLLDVIAQRKYREGGYEGRRPRRSIRRHNVKNPSELVVLGANPAQHKEIVLEPHTTYTIRTNPSAEAIRESFTGMPAEKYMTLNVEGMPAGEYAELGKLLSLYVKPLIGGQVREIRFKKPYPLLITDTSRRQLYFVEGDQDVSQGLGLFNDHPTPGLCELGEVRRIDYKQRKIHLPDPDVDEWKHAFGEENGIKPTLWFNERTKQLFLKGGDYLVRTEGITN